MYLLDKQKVDLTLTVNGNAFLPGEMITGSFRVVTKKEFECTAIKIRCVCLEHAEVRYQEHVGKRTVTRTAVANSVHFEATGVLAGNVAGKGGLQMQRGTMDYPFQIQLPPTVPPSKHVAAASGHMALTWTLEGLIDIPNGFDASTKQSFVVMPAIRAEAFNLLRDAPTAETSVSSKLHTCSCCGCFCCEKKGSHVIITAKLSPSALVMCTPNPTSTNRFDFFSQPSVQAVFEPSNDFFDVLPPNTYTAKACITIQNDCAKDPVTGVTLKMAMNESIHAAGHATSGSRTIAKQEILFGGEDIIQPGSTRHFAVYLQILPIENPWDLAPINTSITESSAYFSIALRDVELDPPFAIMLPINISAAVDFQNLVPNGALSYAAAVNVE